MPDITVETFDCIQRSKKNARHYSRDYSTPQRPSVLIKVILTAKWLYDLYSKYFYNYVLTLYLFTT